MEMFGWRFGGRKTKEPTPAEAIAKLRENEELLTKKQLYWEKKIDDEYKNAKAHLKTNKRLATQALKKKLRYEKELDKICNALTTLEMHRESLQNAISNAAVLEAMKLGADALRKVHKNLGVNDVNDIMDEVNEQLDISSEISEAISSPSFLKNDFDEDDLLEELEMLEKENVDEELARLDPINTNHIDPAERNNSHIRNSTGKENRKLSEILS